MSRIGKRKLNVPSGVDLHIEEDYVKVSGPKGSLVVRIPKGVVVEKVDNVISTKLVEEKKGSKSLWGLTNALLNNALIGVVNGYTKKLELVGVGYRAKKEGSALILSLGFSHQVKFEPPQGVNVEVEENTKISVSGIDKQLVGLVASQIRSLKKPEPYKGKGIRYVGESVRIKPGKAGKGQK